MDPWPILLEYYLLLVAMAGSLPLSLLTTLLETAENIRVEIRKQWNKRVLKF